MKEADYGNIYVMQPQQYCVANNLICYFFLLLLKSYIVFTFTVLNKNCYYRFLFPYSEVTL